MYDAKNTGTRRKRNNRRIIDKHQNEFSKGYISTMSTARMPENGLSDTLNIEIVEDNIPRPRPSLLEYGTQPTLPVVGRGEIRYNGTRSILWMLNDSGTGKVYKQTDGGAITLIGGSYDVDSWSKFTQSKDRVYIWNSTDNLSFIDLTDDSINVYNSLATPSAPTPTKTGLAGTTYTYYYKVTANNAVGESSASIAGSVQVGLLRTAANWSAASNYVTVTWSAVTGADSYTLYVGDTEGNEELLVTVTGLSYKDDGSLFTNFSTIAPLGNSTQGQVFKWMYNDAKNAQLYGVTADNQLYYSAPGTGDFSGYRDGGFVTIDEGGDTDLNYVTVFRNGKGDPVVTTSSRGAAGKGLIHHGQFETTIYGDQAISVMNIYQANGQSASYSPRGVVRARDSLYYPTGVDFKSTGTSRNIVNILSTNTISQVLEPDLERLNLEALDKAVGVEYNDRIYWALPVGSDENNEIWYMDLSRNNLWVLRWTVAAKDLWLYEDNNGTTHFCALVGNKVLEFTRAGSQTTQDDGVPFRTRAAFSSLVWDEDGVTLANIYRQHFKLLQPRGTIAINAYGLTKNGLSNTVGSSVYTSQVSFTGFGVWDYSGNYQYGDDVGEIAVYNQSVGVVSLKPKGLVNQLDWEVVTETANCDYKLSAVNTRGTANVNLIYKG